MNTSKLTQKSQEALQEAQSQALRRQHGEVDGEHLLLALLEQPEGVLPRILRRIEGAEQSLWQALEHEMDRRPRVNGRRSLRDPAVAEGIAKGRRKGGESER